MLSGNPFQHSKRQPQIHNFYKQSSFLHAKLCKRTKNAHKQQGEMINL